MRSASRCALRGGLLDHAAHRRRFADEPAWGLNELVRTLSCGRRACRPQETRQSWPALWAPGSASRSARPFTSARPSLLGFDYSYVLLDLDELGRPPRTSGELVRDARRDGMRGLNVTHPVQAARGPGARRLSPRGGRAGRREHDRLRRPAAWSGTTPTRPAFARRFERRLPGAPLERVVLLGAGGAGSAVAYAILSLGAERLVVLDADEERAAELAAALAPRFGSSAVQAGDLGDLGAAPRRGRRPDPRDPDRHGQPPGLTGAGRPAGRAPLGRRGRLHARSRRSCCAHARAARLPDAGRRRHGRAPGRRLARAVHRRRAPIASACCATSTRSSPSAGGPRRERVDRHRLAERHRSSRSCTRPRARASTPSRSSSRT